VRYHADEATASVLVVYATSAGIGGDGPPEWHPSARVFADIAAMKAGGPGSHKMRVVPAGITPVVWVPGDREGAPRASPAKRAGVGSASIYSKPTYELGHPFRYIGAEVLIGWILFDRPA
jgi:hypothetical protein